VKITIDKEKNEGYYMTVNLSSSHVACHQTNNLGSRIYIKMAFLKYAYANNIHPREV
jgi:hypothetical protein